MTPLYVCLECGSGFFTHSPREGSSVEWHKKVLERNLGWSPTLFDKISAHHRFSSVIDIGCGIGTWLSYCKGRGMKCLGFDTSTECVEFGKQHFGLDLRAELFHSSHEAATRQTADLVTCIMVMEHLEDPAQLAREIARYCLSHRAWCFVSVPFLQTRRHLVFDSQDGKSSVFNDVGAHVTYFSDAGLHAMFRQLGMEPAGLVSGIAWRGYLFKAAGGG